MKILTNSASSYVLSRLLFLLFLAITPTFCVHAQNISLLSDEFNNSNTLTNWLRVNDVEGWNADQLETVDIDTTQAGRLVLMPHTCTWFEDYKGPLLFKEITGDFVATAFVEVSGRDGTGAPTSNFTLSGIMARVPRQVTPQTWQPGGENHVFLSIGTGTDLGNYEYEVKTTTDSNSILELSPGVRFTTLQVARIGSTMLMLRQNQGGNWVVHRRYQRTDFPATLQVGLVAYTDWATVETYQPLTHNQTVINAGNPDMLAAYDYLRFQVPQVPAQYQGSDFSNPAEVDDNALISFLGDVANVPADSDPPACSVTTIRLSGSCADGATVIVGDDAQNAATGTSWSKDIDVTTLPVQVSIVETVGNSQTTRLVNISNP